MGGHAMLLSVDDKCGVKVGEPGMPITAVQRHSKKSIHVYDGKGKQGETLAADHDFSTVTLTPSVTLFIDPPSDPLGSYCRGAPYLSIKNAVFQSSNPFRHAVEMIHAIRDRYQQKTIPPVLVVFSGGGTDHRTNLYSVQLSFLWLMVELDLDEVICVRTAPGDSWVNPAERRMADLNIAWEGASFSRSSVSECKGFRPDHARWFDKHLKSVSSMNGIRKLTEHEDVTSNSIDIRAMLNASVQPVISAMTDSVSRLQSNVNDNWKVLPASTEKQTKAVIQFLQTEVYPQLDIGRMQASAVEGTEAEKILNSHKLESSRYMFHLRKEGQSTACVSKCPVCALKRRLPQVITEHLSPIPFPIMTSGGSYTPFESVYGKPGAENLPAAAKRSLAPRSQKVNTSGTVCRGMIECSSCGKSRGIYSRYKGHFNKAQDLLDASSDELKYICGTLFLFPDILSQTHSNMLKNHPAAHDAKDSGQALKNLRTAVYVEGELTCDDQIEEGIYNSPHINDGAKNICCFCGLKGSMSREKREVSASSSGAVAHMKHQESRPFCGKCRQHNLPRFPRTRNRKRSNDTTKQPSSHMTKRLKDSQSHIETNQEVSASNISALNSSYKGTTEGNNSNQCVPGTAHPSSVSDGPSDFITSGTAVEPNTSAMSGDNVLPKTVKPCAAGMREFFFAKRGITSTPAHMCKNIQCRRRHLGLHNQCNVLRKRPELLPASLQAEGTEHVMFCSATCVNSYGN